MVDESLAPRLGVESMQNVSRRTIESLDQGRFDVLVLRRKVLDAKSIERASNVDVEKLFTLIRL
jgi:hypothetical protein